MWVNEARPYNVLGFLDGLINTMRSVSEWLILDLKITRAAKRRIIG